LQNTLLSGGSGTVPMAAPPTGENTDYLCSEGFDNDGDYLVDCLDPDCDNLTGQPGGALCEFDEEKTCDDSFDNDADGSVDGADSDCVVEPVCGDDICSPSEDCESCKSDCFVGDACIIQNSASNLSCDAVCASSGYDCSAIGTDASASDGKFYSFDGSCITTSDPLCFFPPCDPTGCGTTMSPGSGNVFNPFPPTLCSGAFTKWTNCQCSYTEPPVLLDCGNNVCDPGEGCDNCVQDCSCIPGDICSNNQCTDSQCGTDCDPLFVGPCMMNTYGTACGCCPTNGNYCGDWSCSPTALELTINVGETIPIVVGGYSFDVSIYDISDGWVKSRVVNGVSSWNQEGAAYSTSPDYRGVVLLVYVKSINNPDSATFIFGENAESCPWDCA